LEAGVALASVLLATLFYYQRPKGWDTRALRVKSVRVEPISNLDENLKPKSQGDIFTVDIENTTGSDVTLPVALTVMQASKGTGALHGSFLRPDKDYFIPAHHVRSISLDNAAETSAPETQTRGPALPTTSQATPRALYLTTPKTSRSTSPSSADAAA